MPLAKYNNVCVKRLKIKNKKIFFSKRRVMKRTTKYGFDKQRKQESNIKIKKNLNKLEIKFNMNVNIRNIKFEY